MADIDVRRLAAAGPVHVTIPAEVAFDIEALFEIQRSVFDRLGHRGCYSGADIRFQLEREFFVGVDRSIRGFSEG